MKSLIAHLFKSCLTVALMGMLPPLHAVNYHWDGITSDVHSASNWSPAGGPPTAVDTGTLDLTSGSADPVQSNNALPFSIQSFSYPAARTFTTTISNSALFTFSQAGIVNTGGALQLFNINTGGELLFSNAPGNASGGGTAVTYTLADNASLIFANGATAGTAATVNNSGSLVSFESASLAGSSLFNINNAGEISFDTSDAGAATINLSNQSIANFIESSTGNTANINANSGSRILVDTNSSTPNNFINLNASTLTYDNSANAQGATIAGINGSLISFESLAQGGSANISVSSASLDFNQTAVAQNANISANSGGVVTFSDTADAGLADFQLQGSYLIFQGNSTAAQSIINLTNASQLRFAGAATADISDVTATNSSIIFLENSTSASSIFDLDSSSTLNFQQTGNDLFAGSVEGSGTIYKTGAGFLDFSAVGSLFTGQTQINNGNFILNTSLGGVITAGISGTLSGTGTALGNVIINGGGTISPGNSIGTINVAGNFIQNGGIYFVELNGVPQSDLINVAGTATINEGTVNAASVDGTYVLFTPYQILHAAGGVNGEYSPGTFFTNPSLGINLLTQPNDIFLILGTNFRLYALTRNQFNVASQFDALTSPTAAELNIINNLFTLTPDELRHALDQMGGEQYTSLIQITRFSTQRFLRRLYDPMRDVIANRGFLDACYDTINLWGALEGGYSTVKRNHEAHAYHLSDINLTIGAQKRFCEYWTAGAALSYEYDRLNYNLGGSGSLNYAQAALYGAFTDPAFYAFSNLAFGYNYCQIKRRIQFAEIDYTAIGKPEIFQTSFYTEIGKNFFIKWFNFQPFVAVEIDDYYRFHFHEHDADILSLDVKKRNLTIFSTRLGFHIQTVIGCGFELAGDLAWQHNYNLHKDHIHTHFTGFGDEFSIVGVDLGRDGFDANLSISKDINDDFNVYLEFSGQVWERYRNGNLTAGVIYSW